jgi:phosphoribosyl 1,2-cyclic phosphodiesterase
MSLFIASLNSGSNGNCYYVGNHEEAILIDAGISCRETEKRMKRLGLSMQAVRAVFISHEHGDHIAGLEVLARRHFLPVYITTPMRQYVKVNGTLHSFQSHVPVQIGGLSVTAFPKFHDAVDPYSFVIEHNNVRVGVFTDIGVACETVIRYFKQCHAVILEANYDEEMLEKGSYPWHLKKRIRGGDGHLSNLQALELFRTHRPPFMTHLVLAHLSRNNNCPDLVHRLFSAHAGNTRIVVASRYEETPVMHITDNGVVNEPATLRASILRKKIVKDQRSQLTLFS